MKNNNQNNNQNNNVLNPKREKRVIFVIIILFFINITDLIATLLYNKLTTNMELNQLANYLFEHSGDTAVIIYKSVLTCFSLGVLYLARKMHIAEKAAWFLFIIFVCLTIYWFIFALTFAEIIPDPFYRTEVENLYACRRG